MIEIIPYAVIAFVISFVVGAALGIFVTKRMIELAITKADLCNDDKCMIRDALGIPS